MPQPDDPNADASGPPRARPAPIQIAAAVGALVGVVGGCAGLSWPGAGALEAARGQAIAGPALQPDGRYLRDWLLLGEFPVAEDTAARLDRDFLESAGGEAGIRPVRGSAQPRPDGTNAVWQDYFSPSDVVDLKSVYGGVRPTTDVLAYAYTTFVSERDGPAYLALGSDGAIRVWLNGVLVHESRHPRRFAPNQDLVSVGLVRGTNHLLLETDDGEAGWRFAARVATRRQTFPEASDGDLLLRYGHKLYSRNREELIIRHFFQDRRDGVFVDVGAGHYRRDSNTYYLEQHLGWSGLAIDALAEFAGGYREFRPRTTFLAYAVTDRNEGTIRFYRSRSWILSSTRKDLAERTGLKEEIEVPQATLDRLLDGQGIERIDLLNMDIELGEPVALAGFDIRRFRPRLVCIEAWGPVQDQIAAYFAENGYRRIHTYMAFDEANWYYTPNP